jgi:hypothetical protein
LEPGNEGSGIEETINPRPLTITPLNAIRSFGQPNPPLSFTASGLVLSDTIETALTGALSSPATPNSPAGAYPITLGTLTAQNYSLQLTPATLTVTSLKVPTLTWPTLSAITYGTALSAAQLNASASFNQQPLAGTFSYDPPLGTVLAAGTEQPITVTFTPSDSATYASVTALNPIDVSKAILTITATDFTRLFGKPNPTLTFTATGLVNADTVATALIGQLTTNAQINSLVGSYPITQGTLSAANYQIVFVPGTLTITSVAPKLVAVGSAFGAPGSTFVYTAEGFTPNESLAVLVNGNQVLRITANEVGQVRFALLFGTHIFPGEYVITVASAAAPSLTGATLATTTITIDRTAPRLTPALAPDLPQAWGQSSIFLPLSR